MKGNMPSREEIVRDRAKVAGVPEAWKDFLPSENELSQIENDSTAAARGVDSATVSRSADSSGQSRASTNAMKRYGDAYLLARFYEGIGATAKGLAIAFAGVCLFAGFVLAVVTARFSVAAGIGPMMAGAVVGAAVALPVYLLGILIAAQGEILKAHLDTAVHSSPFLDREQMARIMSLQ